MRSTAANHIYDYSKYGETDYNAEEQWKQFVPNKKSDSLDIAALVWVLQIVRTHRFVEPMFLLNDKGTVQWKRQRHYSVVQR